MNFILKMAWRDSRASRRRLALVSLSVVLGIAALVGIASLGDNLKAAVEDQTKSLLGSDLSVTASRDFPADTVDFFRTQGEIAREWSVNTMVSFPTRGSTRWRGQARALEGGFPFYGELQTSPAGAMKKLTEGNNAVVEESLLAQFGVEIGDEVRVGKAVLKVVGALKKIPGEPPALALLTPRVYMSRASLETTDVLKVDRFVRYRVHFRLPPKTDPAAVEKMLGDKFRG